MRCGSGKRKERIKFIKKNRKVCRRWKMKEDDRY